MLVLGIVLVIAIGFLAVNCISVKFTWSEKIGLAFPVGIGLQTMMMLIINLLKIKLITASVMLGGVLILLLLLSFLYKRRDGVIMYYKKAVRIDTSNCNLVWCFFIVLIAYFEYMNFTKCMYFPTFDRDSLAGFIDGLPDVAYDTAERNFRYTNIRRAYKSASQVNYVARCGSFGDKGIEYSPALKVFKTIMDYDYLWINIRVKGGAYGCMNGYNVTGNGYFCSYRDPNLKQTDIIYEGIPEYIRNFNATEREMTKYIIGTFSGLDIPLTPQRKGSRSFESWMRGADEEYYRKDRAGVLNTYQDDIKALEPVIKAILSDNRLCVIGNSGSIDDNAELFDEIYNLL